MVGLVAVTTHARGGGVAAVSRLIWRAMQDRWADDTRLQLLAPAEDSTESGAIDRLRCGGRVASLQRSGCEWLIFSHLSVAQIQAYVPRRWRRPYGIFLHGIEAWRPMTSRQRRVVEGAALLLTNSRYTAQRVREVNPWIGPMEVCPLALDADWPFDADAPDRRAAGSRDTLVVGRMSAGERYKGHDELLNAWPLVLRSLPDARLVFAGGGDDAPRLRARAEQLGISASVHFTGFISHDELLGWYARSALFAMPSRNEGFGIVYLEAMAHGLPCLASPHDAAREVVEDGVTGALVDPDNREALAGTTIRLLSDPPLRIRLGRCGQRRVRERFSYDVFRDRLLPILDARLGSSSIIATASL